MLLVARDVLLQERHVSRAASHLMFEILPGRHRWNARKLDHSQSA
jgi:hypothetical protein